MSEKPIQQLPVFLSAVLKDVLEVLQETVQRVKERLSEPGKPITYPVQWDSLKQRRAFFATNGFGGGIPHVRRGSEAHWWKIEQSEYGVTLSGAHPAGAVEGLPGGWQSRIHRNRWNNTRVVLLEELAKIPAEIGNKLSMRDNA